MYVYFITYTFLYLKYKDNDFTSEIAFKLLLQISCMTLLHSLFAILISKFY